MGKTERKIDTFGAQVVSTRGFWGGWGGVLITLSVMGMVIALLVGWVLLWVNQKNSPNITLLTLGCVAFALVLMVLATIQNRLTTYWRLRQAQAAYLTGVSHNLRTPIASIRAAAQALESPEIDRAHRQKLLHAIVLETRLLGLRVDNVLETGRLEIERAALALSPLDLSSLIERALQTPADIVASRGGDLSSDVSPNLKVKGDARALRLVIDNLLDNAIKYCDSPPQIVVQCSAENQKIKIRVQDRGIGLSGAEKHQAFRRFWRGSSGQSGTGLGLWLAKAIVEGHAGHIRLENNGGQRGCTVTVTLPQVV
jgi:signal transduction histidine kinase